ncbi:MAG: ferrous iron transport protein A [candidate division Zixibacteria bacterium]|nr:ferrous iron transport protein A [candidate division Zixibacteria bacterium]
MTSLDKMLPGQKARVVGFVNDGPIARRLVELGIMPGRSLLYVRDAPLRDPLEIKIGTSFLSLRRFEASLVAVELED